MRKKPFPGVTNHPKCIPGDYVVILKRKMKRDPQAERVVGLVIASNDDQITVFYKQGIFTTLMSNVAYSITGIDRGLSKAESQIFWDTATQLKEEMR